jgi:sugar (pentulose or hexulose) kinase
METAGEGGPWGMALLAAYMLRKEPDQSMERYLYTQVFSDALSSEIQPDPAGAAGFAAYLTRYKEGLAAEKAAAQLN